MWMDLIARNGNVRKALTLFGGLEHNWRNLYLIVEVIEDSCGGETALVGSQWCPAPERLRLFKRTANNWQALGTEARHATERWQKPTDLMTLAEAQAVVRSTLFEWLQTL
jgi:hypothetical protein